jgi:hypothetical protein
MTRERVLASHLAPKTVQPAEPPSLRLGGVFSSSTAPLANRKYIATVDGQTREGVTDGNGFADIDARPGSDIQAHLVFRAPTGDLKPQQG